MGAGGSKEKALKCSIVRKEFNALMDQIDDAHAVNQKLAELVKLKNLPIVLAENQIEVYTDESLKAFRMRPTSDFYDAAVRVNHLVTIYNNDLELDEKREIIDEAFDNNNNILITLVGELGELCPS